MIRAIKFGCQGASVSEQGGGLGIQTGLDKICLDSESLKGALGIRKIMIPLPQCKMAFLK